MLEGKEMAPQACLGVSWVCELWQSPAADAWGSRNVMSLNSNNVVAADEKSIEML